MPEDDTIVVTAEEIAAATGKPAVDPVSSPASIPPVTSTPDVPIVSRTTAELPPPQMSTPVSQPEQTINHAPQDAKPTITTMPEKQSTARLPGDDRVQQALRAVSTPAPIANMFGGIKEALQKATEKAKKNADESALQDHSATMGAFSAQKLTQETLKVVPSVNVALAETRQGGNPLQPTATPPAGGLQAKAINVMSKELETEVGEEPRSPKSTNANVLRTLEADSAEFIRANKVSMTTVALKEAARERVSDAQTKSQTTRTVLLVSLSLLLLLGGGGAILFAYMKSYPPVPVTLPAQTGIATISFDPIIFTETKKQINLANEKGKSAGQILMREVANSNEKLGSMQAIFLASGEDIRTLLSASDVLGRIASRVPARLLRQIDPTYTFGLLVGSTNEGFLILTTENYDTVFADMLAWEPEFARDMYAVLSGNEISKEVLSASWEDTVVRNIDVRELKTANEDDALIWGFVNQKTLVIARNAPTFKEVLTRLTTPKPVSR